MEDRADALVLFGATGDLARRKLFPALYHLAAAGRLGVPVVGVAASGWDDAKLGEYATAAVDAAVDPVDRSALGEMMGRLAMVSGDYRDPATFDALARRLAEAGAARPVHYLAIPPAAFPVVVEGLAGVGLQAGARVVVEKPFGRDLASSQELNQLVHQHFDESQVYRIDHYLGKETVQNLLVFRFANPIFETLWNRDRVDHVQITVAEEIGIEGRGGYYEQAGALRDVVQNHLTQLLTLVAMEIPGSFDADAIRNEKVKVLQAISPIDRDDLAFSQYAAGRIDGRDVTGYRQEPGVSPDSQVETYAALRLEVENWRWHGVPFYLRAGKRLARRLTQIVVTFRRPPVSLFPSIQDSNAIQPNVLAITIQPDEGFELGFEVKAPGQEISLKTQRLHFRYAEAFSPLADAYETLLLDVLTGDQTLFVRSDEVEAAWRLYMPVLEKPPSVDFYAAGTWGPSAADRLLTKDGQRWHPA